MTVTEVTETAVLSVPINRVWEVISCTQRYADWVAGVLEVTEHHGTAEIGKTYSERNRTIGPLSTRSVWTVREIDAPEFRVDTAVGFEPLHDMTNIFRLRSVDDSTTEMTYTVHYRPGLGPIGKAIDTLQQPGLRKAFQISMRNLEDLIIAEGTIPPGP